MNVGSGVDLIDVIRFEREVARRGDALIEELFSGAERAWCGRRRRRAQGHAMLYAAKEALFKALGTGKVGRMAWHDIELAWPEGDARPAMTLSGETAGVAEQLGLTVVHAAMTATQEHAVAWVMLTGLGIRDSGLVCHAEATAHRSTARPPEPRVPTNVGERSQW